MAATLTYVPHPTPQQKLSREIESLRNMIQATDKSIAEYQSAIVNLTTKKQGYEAKVTEYTLALQAIEVLPALTVAE